jgi:iron uptake system component EfeO
VKPSPNILLTVAVLATLAMAACSSSSSASADATTIQVTSTDAGCQLSATTAPAGPVVFTVKNDGGSVTEFYLYKADGTSIVGEVENIGPGTSRNLPASLEAGTYVSACKPGEVGDGIRGDFTVTS